MGGVEIVIIVFAVLAVLGALATYIVRKIKGKPTGSCAGCPYSKNCNRSCHAENVSDDNADSIKK